MKPELTSTVVDGRPGWVDKNGQVFAVPKSAGRQRFWLAWMSQFYAFVGAA